MINRYYVYVYKDNNGDVVYVGKGTGSRMRDHIRKAKNLTSKSYNLEFKLWILHYINTYNVDPTCEIYEENLSNNEALLLEEKLIMLYGRKDLGLGKLFNKTCGGEKCCGRIVSQHEKYAKSLWMKNNSPSLNSDVKFKLSRSAKIRFRDKRNHPMYGKTHSHKSINQMVENFPDRSGEFNSNNKYIYTIKLCDMIVCVTFNIRQFCDDNNLKYRSVNMKFCRMKTDIITFKGWCISRTIK